MPVGISTGVSYLNYCQIRFYHLGPFQNIIFICQNKDGGFQDSDDDWETDPDHINVMSEEQQRYLLIFMQGCISCGILVSGIGARGVSSEHMENMEMFSLSPT